MGAEVIHLDRRAESVRCRARTADGKPCRNRALESGFCRRHDPALRPAIVGEPSRFEKDLERALAFLRRRMTGDYPIDDFGFDSDLTENVLIPMFRPLFDRWWRIEQRGLEHIPAKGPALLVANHSGVLPFDAVMMKLGVFDGAGRHCRLLAADLPFRLPFIGELARKSGNTLACVEDATRLLDAGEILGVFPEGYKGIGKHFRDRYRLQRFG